MTIEEDSLELHKKIRGKINILEEESFSDLMAAIRAWKQSELYGLYLDIGRQSMEQKKPIAEIIALGNQSGRPTLTEEEFKAISDLNQKLRY